MVGPIRKATPSVNAQKNYLRHDIAFEGQYCQLRNYAVPKQKITIKQTNICNHQEAAPIIAPGGTGVLGFICDVASWFLGSPSTPTKETVTVNNNEQTLKDLEKQIADLEKENKELKANQKAKVDDKAKVTPTNVEKADEPEITAEIKKKTIQSEDKKEDVVYEPSYFKAEKKRSHWYDFAQAYDIPKGVTLKQVYQAIQKRNGYSAQNQEPPQKVMLPLELDINGIKVKRKDQYTIPKHDIPQAETGNCVGRATGGTPEITKGTSSTEYSVYQNNTRVKGGLTETQAKNEYKTITGKDFSGTIADES